MKDEIKEFEEFRSDEDGTYFYYIDKDGNEQWSYKLDNLKDYITNLQKENSEQLDENLKQSEWLVKKQKRIEKARELINKNSNYPTYYLTGNIVKELLNILNCGDE